MKAPMAGRSKMKPLAVALMSGGMDSCVAAAIAQRRYRVAALHASYGQRTAGREKRAFRQICARMGIEETLELDLGFLKKIGGSSLTDPSRPVPELHPVKGIPSTYVPFRNGILLAAAASWAEALGARAVFIGAVAPDGPDGYPDTTRAFFNAFEGAVKIGTKPQTKIRMMAPLVDADKAEVARRGLKLKAPLELTWSCYQSEKIACGRCLSCIGRLKAFEKIGVEDHIRYEGNPGKR